MVSIFRGNALAHSMACRVILRRCRRRRQFAENGDGAHDGARMSHQHGRGPGACCAHPHVPTFTAGALTAFVGTFHPASAVAADYTSYPAKPSPKEKRKYHYAKAFFDSDNVFCPGIGKGKVKHLG